ncbi:MAG: FtsX-like permease family protein [Flavobacteriaceae bacterium]|jgi:lipoprotein-releasing system permease protein|nr:FtsX-like permease family protein [Flavobacteriaceae bacterium]
MKFETYMASRFRKSSSYKNTVSSPIIKISVLSISIGIIMMIISISSSVGLQKTIKSKVSSFFGDISISNFQNISSESSIEPIDFSINHKDLIDNNKIYHIQKVAYKSGLIINNDSFEGVVLKGISTDFNWEHFSKYITKGSILNISDSISNEVIISENLSNKLDINLHEKFKATFFKQNSLSTPNQRIFKVAGIYESGLIEFDEIYFFGDIKHIQKMNRWKNNQVGNIELFLQDQSDIEKVSTLLYEETSSQISVISILEKFPEIFNWIALFDINVLLIIIIMILVGGINMITALLVTVLEKTQIVGILKTLGSSNKSIKTIFLINGVYLISIGLVIGNFIAIGLIQLQNYTGLIKLDPNTYYVTELPFDFDLISIIILNISVLFFCFLMLIVPSFIISKISPSESIKIK